MFTRAGLIRATPQPCPISGWIQVQNCARQASSTPQTTRHSNGGVTPPQLRVRRVWVCLCRTLLSRNSVPRPTPPPTRGCATTQQQSWASSGGNRRQSELGNHTVVSRRSQAAFVLDTFLTRCDFGRPQRTLAPNRSRAVTRSAEWRGKRSSRPPRAKSGTY